MIHIGRMQISVSLFCIFVLNLTIVMRGIKVFFCLMFVTLSAAGLALAQSSGPFIAAPFGGQALQGVVEVRGSVGETPIAGASLFFGYTEAENKTWFPLAMAGQPVKEGVLARWDTTMMTDGQYDLQLRVDLKDGSQLTAEVRGVRVRNYSPLEADTPVPVAPDRPTLTPYHTRTPVPTATYLPYQPTPAPTNSLRVMPDHLLDSLSGGAVAAVLFFILLGVYLVLRRAMRY